VSKFVIIFFITTLGFFFSKLSFSNNNRAQASIVIGSVESRRDISRFRNVYLGNLFRSGDIIKTYSNSYLEIILFNNNRIKLYPNTLIHLIKINNTSLDIVIDRGKISIEPYDNEYGKKKFEYQIFVNKTKLISQKSENYFFVIHDTEKKITKILVLNGSVILQSTDEIDKKISINKDKQIIFYDKPLLDRQNTLAINQNDLSEIENNSFPSHKTLSNFDPNLAVKSPVADPFLIRKKRFTDKRDNISNFRKQKDLYYQFQVGVSYITNQFYYLVLFNPKITFQHIEAQLRFLAYVSQSKPISPNNWYNLSEWDFRNTKDSFEDIISKIGYISYINKKKKLSFLLGEIESNNLGYGLVVNRYSNSIFYPQKYQLGLIYNLDFDALQFKGFLANIIGPKLFALRVETRPFFNPEVKTFDKYRFGINFAMDIDPKSSSNDLKIYLGSIDINIPIMNKLKENFMFSLFSELAIQGYEFNNQLLADVYQKKANKLVFIEKSFGFSIGLKGILVQILNFKTEYRYLAKGFITEYLDTFYDINRSKKADLLLQDNKPDFHGFLFGLGVIIPKIINIYTEIYHESRDILNMDKLNNRFHIELSSSKYFIPIFKIKIRYDRQDIPSFNKFFKGFFSDKSFFTNEIRYAISKNFDIIFIYRRFFENHNNGYFGSDYLSLSSFFIF